MAFPANDRQAEFENKVFKLNHPVKKFQLRYRRELLEEELDRQAHTVNALNYAMGYHAEGTGLRDEMFKAFGIASALVVGLTDAIRAIEKQEEGL